MQISSSPSTSQCALCNGKEGVISLVLSLYHSADLYLPFQVQDIGPVGPVQPSFSQYTGYNSYPLAPERSSNYPQLT